MVDLNPYYKSVVNGISKRWFDFRYGYDRIDILSEDWNNLFVLDGCRFDAFSKVNRMSGKLQRRFSKAPNTKRWLLSNFANRDLSNIIYITANPIYLTVDHEFDFKRIIDIWETEWNDGIGTVEPEKVLAKAKKYLRLNARVIVHFVQPHQPFIGFDKTPDGKVWPYLRNGEITELEAWNGYCNNLWLALEAIKSFDQPLENTVITSDHGNEFGSPYLWKRLYGHPPIHTRNLLTIPWFEVAL